MTPGATLLLLLAGATTSQAPVTPTRTATVHGRDDSDPTAHGTQTGANPTAHGRTDASATAQGS